MARGTQCRPNLFCTCSTTLPKSAFSRSILLTKMKRGNPLPSAIFHISSVPTSMPDAAQMTMTAASATATPATAPATKSA